MDPLDVLTHKHNILPYFQPIFSADEHEVIGYEVLGRINMDGTIQSLGPFFQDESVPDEFFTEIDDHIQIQALEFFLNKGDPDLKVFLNRSANELMKDFGESLITLLLSFRDRGFPMKNIVIEIKEHEYTGSLSDLTNVLTYYRTYGIQVAVDNIGKGGSNLDRLHALSPDIFKIDLKELMGSDKMFSYQDVLHPLSLMARKIGATLLFEDIEVPYQLQYAWKHGGRYFQGYYLEKPQPHFIHKEYAKEILQTDIHRFIKHEKRKLYARYSISEHLNQQLRSLCSRIPSKEYDEMVHYLAKGLTDVSFRLYICNEDGFQLSSNIIKNATEWTLQPEYKAKNWSWRPYFLENIVRMNYLEKGFLSDLYSDIETGETIRTFSFPINKSSYVFIDIPYEYLYENSDLL